MSLLLKYTNPYGEEFFLVNLGAQWPHRPALRLIEGTTRYADKAREFATVEEAEETLVVAGGPARATQDSPVGWEIVERS